ncbi:MAG: hypothetical protein MUC96_23405 [Myxococcaceae bacterium]|jgi:hypothetical protein|nr:hypothetical protein [Myxococcaceae bacterium]
MPVADETLAVSVLPPLPLQAPSKQQLEAEAALLGDAFPAVSSHPADLVADADELLLARADAPELARRGYHVADGQFERVALLRSMLAPLAAEQTRVAEVSKVKTEAAEAARARLLAIRSSLAAIGKAAGLPAGVFSLDTSHTTRLNVVMMKMEEVLHNVQAYRSHLPDQQRVDGLVTEARGLIDAQRANRQEARLLRTDGSLESRKQARLERLLLNAMQYLSAQGLAAFPEDPVREPRYRLDHVYGNRTSKVADPGAKPADGE